MASEGIGRRADEPRWPVALAIVAVLALLAVLPERIRLAPQWATGVMVVSGVLPMALVSITGYKPVWLRVERIVTLIFFGLMALGTLASLGYLIRFMIRRSTEIHGLELLTSSMGVWVNNVLMFSLLYWQIDRGGPGARASGAQPKPDWYFPQESVPAEKLPPHWGPTYVDYLFLAFATGTAFSPTDVVPLTGRAKLMMMLESSISLMTIVVVAARAINVLGS